MSHRRRLPSQPSTANGSQDPLTTWTRAYFDQMMSDNARVIRGEAAMPTLTRQRAARHEAAHGIAAVRLGGTFDEVAISDQIVLRPNGTPSLGHCDSTFRYPRVVEVTAVLWAGAVVDEHIFGASRDLDEVRKLTGSLDSKLSLGGLKVAAVVVKQHRAALDAVAAALESTGRLSYAEVIELAAAAGLTARTST